MTPPDCRHSVERTREQIRVLCVDDESFTALTRLSLERQSDALSVHTETRVSDALEYLETVAVDCIVSDYDMPKRTGLEFLRAVRETVGEVSFILFTGKGSEEIASEAIAAGATNYFRKEFGAHQYAVLAKHIENAVESDRRGRV